MSYTNYEASIAKNRPVRLYLFERSAEAYWGFTNADRDIDFKGYTYKASAIEDDGFRQTGEPVNDLLKVTVPQNNEVAMLFRISQPSQEVTLTVRELHFEDRTDASVIWVGTVASVSYPAGSAIINCASLEASLETDGLKRSYNRNCDYAVYSTNCRLNKDHFAVPAEIVTLDGASITVRLLATPRGSLNYGFIEWQADDNKYTERRGIDSANGTILNLLGGTVGLQAGQSITVYPGCNQTSQNCDVVFNNLLNFGGFSHIPGKSPFDGSPID